MNFFLVWLLPVGTLLREFCVAGLAAALLLSWVCKICVAGSEILLSTYIEYGILGEGYHISTNQSRESSVFETLPRKYRKTPYICLNLT